MAGSNVSAVTNLVPTVNEGFATTVGSPGITSGGAVVPLASVSGLTNGSVFVGIVEPNSTNQQEFTGTVDTAGSQITGVVWTRGTNVSHASGVTVVDYTTGTALNMIAKHLLTEHNQNGTHSSAFLNKVYPVGSIYLNAANSTNPGTLLGFGTWSAFGAGRTLVGVGTSDQAFANGTTGGESNHTLTSSEMPVHSHSASTDVQGAHSHSFTRDLVVTSASGSSRTSSTGGQQLAWSTGVTTTTDGGHGHNITVNNTGSGSAHNNLPPYIVCYMWQRTA